MIDNAALQSILATATDFSLVTELYASNAVPSADGFDPPNAIGLFAAVEGITFRGETYTRLVQKFGNIKTTMTEEINSASVTFSNISREIAQFEFGGTGFEGLIIVIRLLSRGRSVALTDTQILFTGRCERPSSGDKESLTVHAKSILGSVDVVIPRRTFGPEDFKGRTPNDPEFEGFIHMPSYGSFTYPRIEKRGGFLGWWNKKQVIATQHYSSYSDLDAKKAVPIGFGRVQIMLVLIGAVDVGPFLQLRLAVGEGPIQDIINARSLDPALPLHPTSYVELYGLPGVLNGPDDPTWVAPGYYSRTAHIRGAADNSLLDVTDPAPEVVAVIEWLIITTPSAGVWNTQAWTNNPAAVTRFVWNDPDFFNLDANWIDDEYSTACWNFNSTKIFNTAISDFSFVEEA